MNNLKEELEKKRREAWVDACMITSRFSANNHNNDEMIFSMGFNAAMKELLPKLEKLEIEIEELKIKNDAAFDAMLKIEGELRRENKILKYLEKPDSSK